MLDRRLFILPMRGERRWASRIAGFELASIGGEAQFEVIQKGQFRKKKKKREKRELDWIQYHFSAHYAHTLNHLKMPMLSGLLLFCIFCAIR
ncbi:hypothetical protein GYMLUDRAFT_908338 [Collybiopsis luxurians FD-317 M1]|nr:hypothetical protein GYMLUDRAFT_908338 [Collybiopsis luxurians FD-317 M1]